MIPSRDRRYMVRTLADIAIQLDDEAKARDDMARADRTLGLASWNDTMTLEIRRAAGQLRLVTTLLVQGGMATGRGKQWVEGAKAYLRLVRSADNTGVIR
jgi:hypothetical protein